MSQVDFNDEHKASVLYSRFQSSEQVPTLVQWVMKMGLAKTPTVANAILLGIAVVAAITAGIIFYNLNGGGGNKRTLEQQKAFERSISGNSSQVQ